MPRTTFSELRDAVVAMPAASERLAALRAETLDEICDHERRPADVVSQTDLDDDP